MLDAIGPPCLSAFVSRLRDVALLRMEANESKPNEVRIMVSLGPDGKVLPSPPTENPNPDPDPEAVLRALRKHVPEVTTGRIRILGLARQPGKRSAIAVASSDPNVIDPVGVCVGERGIRAKALVSELGGEMIDVVRWEESTERFIGNLLAPLRLMEASFDEARREAKVQVVRRSGSHKPDFALRSKLLMDLTGWKLHVDIKHEG